LAALGPIRRGGFIAVVGSSGSGKSTLLLGFEKLSAGGTLSGGQRQRILIARAIVHRPRIIFFDEAASALDNRSQEIVTQSLNQLRATRIVIAHRLSTVINADRIIVMDKGKIAQVGDYKALIDVPGIFQDLARRQIL